MINLLLLDFTTITIVDDNVNIYISGDYILLLQDSLNSFIHSITNSLFGSTITLSEASNSPSFNPPKLITFSNIYNMVDIYAGTKDILSNIGSRNNIYIDPIQSYTNTYFRIHLLLPPLIMLINYISNLFVVSLKKIIYSIDRTFYINRKKFKKPFLFVKSFLENK